MHWLMHSSSLFFACSTPYDVLSLLSQSFAKFFSDKIDMLHMSLLVNRLPASPLFPPLFILHPPNFSSFTWVTTGEVSKLLSQSLDTNNCYFNHVPTVLLQQCSHPISYNLIQILLCAFSPQKSDINKNDLGNCRHISRLSFQIYWKSTLHYVILTIYLPINNLLNFFQSAYIKHYSTETILYSPFMIISSKLWVINKSLVSHFLTYRPLLKL